MRELTAEVGCKSGAGVESNSGVRERGERVCARVGCKSGVGKESKSGVGVG